MRLRSLLLVAVTLLASPSCKKPPNLGGVQVQKYLPKVTYDNGGLDVETPLGPIPLTVDKVVDLRIQ